MTHVIMVVIISDPVVATENRRLKDQLTKLEAEVKSEWHVLCISHSSTMWSSSEIKSQPSTPKKLSINMNDDESFSAEREGDLIGCLS